MRCHSVDCGTASQVRPAMLSIMRNSTAAPRRDKSAFPAHRAVSAPALLPPARLVVCESWPDQACVRRGTASFLEARLSCKAHCSPAIATILSLRLRDHTESTASPHFRLPSRKRHTLTASGSLLPLAPARLFVLWLRLSRLYHRFVQA